MPEEVGALIDYLHQHRSQRTNGGNFKDTTFTGAVEHIKTFYSSGKPKDIKSVKYKWGMVSNLVLDVNPSLTLDIAKGNTCHCHYLAQCFRCPL
jgi:hypothetical protein